jgi:hypothetical protein
MKEKITIKRPLKIKVPLIARKEAKIPTIPIPIIWAVETARFMKENTLPRK